MTFPTSTKLCYSISICTKRNCFMFIPLGSKSIKNSENFKLKRLHKKWSLSLLYSQQTITEEYFHEFSSWIGCTRRWGKYNTVVDYLISDTVSVIHGQTRFGDKQIGFSFFSFIAIKLISRVFALTYRVQPTIKAF